VFAPDAQAPAGDGGGDIQPAIGNGG
jgi:hypothetical protein